MKYIMLLAHYNELKKKVPVIFPNFMVHSIVASYMKNAMLDHQCTKVEVVSAGDWNMTSEEATGRSTTLKLSADPSDTDTIRSYEYCHGVQ